MGAAGSGGAVAVRAPERLLAPAKLTTSLRVTGRRDDGYHLLDAEMVTVGLYDELVVDDGAASDDAARSGGRPGEPGGLTISDEVDWIGLPGAGGDVRPGEVSDGAGGVGAPQGVGGENLVVRALAAVGRSSVRCHLTKRIPSAAGLGGGSADAAAILRWAGATDPAIAVRLGADVPFCVLGGHAQVSGIGEVVEPLASPPTTGSATAGYLLVTPWLAVSTPRVYQAWDEAGGPRGDHGNDLEPAALIAYPGLCWWRDLMGAAVGERPRLAGSGGTWFVAGERERLVEWAAQIRAEIVAGRERAMVVVTELVR